MPAGLRVARPSCGPARECGAGPTGGRRSAGGPPGRRAPQRAYSCRMQQKRRAGDPAGTDVVEVYDEFVYLVRFLTAGERAHDGSLTLAQHSLLGYIARNPGCRATDISEVFGVNRSTVSRQLRNGVDAGWVDAGTGPTRLGHPLHLTARGTALLAATVARRHDEVRAGLDGWGEDDLELFVRLLRRFREGVESTATPPTDKNDGVTSA